MGKSMQSKVLSERRLALLNGEHKTNVVSQEAARFRLLLSKTSIYRRSCPYHRRHSNLNLAPQMR
jgi:hypothetical protein